MTTQTQNISGWFGTAIRESIIFPAMRLWTPYNVGGLAHLDPTTNYIFAANHSSHLDTPLVLAALPAELRARLRVAAAADYFFADGLRGRFVAAVLNAFPFARRGTAGLFTAATLLADGHSLLIFPEGTRNTEGDMKNFKPGVGRLTLMSGAAVVPTYIEGTAAAWPKGTRFPQHQSLHITFGAPLRFGKEDSPAEVAAVVEGQVRALSGIAAQAA